MTRGIIMRIMPDKGYMFVKAQGPNGGEFFAHRSSVVAGRFEDLQEGDAVRFEETNGPKGPRAERVEAE
jgi:cold shock protein